MNLVKKTVYLSQIKAGDTVEHEGILHTVSRKCIKYCSFMGYSFKGDASIKKITRVYFLVPTNNGNILR